jgi:hypothetical protein
VHSRAKIGEDSLDRLKLAVDFEGGNAMRSIADSAVEHGLIAHRFYGSEDGQVMAVDEPLMQQAGVSGEPQITFWRKLETHDDVGWEG